MPSILLNGEKVTLGGTSFEELLSSQSIPENHRQSLAIALNGRVVPRASWPETRIAEGDQIEIVKPFVGG